MKNLISFIYILISTLTLMGYCHGSLAGAGITPYKIEINQGNVLLLTDIEQLKIGMNKQQVKFLIGQPVLNNIFNPDRWDYIEMTRYKNNSRTVQTSRLTLHFKQDKLNNMTGALALKAFGKDINSK